MSLPKMTFPTFFQMYPDSLNHTYLKQFRERLRYYGYQFLHRKQCNELLTFLNDQPQWQPLFTQNYYRFNSLLTTYCDKRFSAPARLKAIIDNLNLAEAKMGQTCCQKLLNQGSILLSHLPDDLHLLLNINQIDPFEGYFSINIKNLMNEHIYDASFTFLTPNKLLIASIQGPSGKNAQDMIKQATKSLYGIRPMFMLMNVFKILAQKWQCELLGIPHNAQGKYRLSARSKILFNYNTFWQENQGKYHEHYWHIPLLMERKSLEEVASKKRSMYRKRYEMLDQVEKDIFQV